MATKPKSDILTAELEPQLDLVMRHKILLVGSTETHAKQLDRILCDLGYEVVWEKTGGHALARMASEAVSLVIAELKLEELDGPELLARMREDSRFERTPFMFIASAEEQETMAAAAQQANDILSLPFRPQELRVRLQNLISLSEYERFLLDENRQLTLELLDKNQKLEENFASLHKAHAEMRALQAQLVQSAKMASIGILGTGIAHEINNPLAIIVGYNAQLPSQLKKPQIDKEAVQKIHDRISVSASRITRIIESLRRLSIKQVGEADPYENLRVDDMLPLLVDFFAERAKATSIETKFELNAGAARIRVEPAVLRQTFLAVINNALDAMESSPKRELTISSRATETHVEVTIGDTGPGIPKAIVGQIFDPFFTTKDPDKGTGLGLTMAYRSVREFGGDITVVSPSSGGARFTLCFPKSI